MGEADNFFTPPCATLRAAVADPAARPTILVATTFSLQHLRGPSSCPTSAAWPSPVRGVGSSRCTRTARRGAHRRLPPTGGGARQRRVQARCSTAWTTWRAPTCCSATVPASSSNTCCSTSPSSPAQHLSRPHLLNVSSADDIEAALAKAIARPLPLMEAPGPTRSPRATPRRTERTRILDAVDDFVAHCRAASPASRSTSCAASSSAEAPPLVPALRLARCPPPRRRNPPPSAAGFLCLLFPPPPPATVFFITLQTHSP